ncbi:MAG: hypothetical protein K2K92_09085 [Duncaniella sp.]|nr:hypothetical protein [Duncaniella sp.]
MDKNTNKAADMYPGAAVDQAYDEKVTPKEVIEETKELNDNPRNNSLDETPVK